MTKLNKRVANLSKVYHSFFQEEAEQSLWLHVKHTDISIGMKYSKCFFPFFPGIDRHDCVIPDLSGCWLNVTIHQIGIEELTSCSDIRYWGSVSVVLLLYSEMALGHMSMGTNQS